MINFLRNQDRSDLTYWLGLLLLFFGLAFNSVASALIITGAIIAAESVITSYLTAWINK